MTPSTSEIRTTAHRMPIERITLDLNATGLYAARFAAAARDQSLDEWISDLVRSRAIHEAMQSAAERDRSRFDGPPGWADEVMDGIFGEGEP